MPVKDYGTIALHRDVMVQNLVYSIMELFGPKFFKMEGYEMELIDYEFCLDLFHCIRTQACDSKKISGKSSPIRLF